MKKSFLVFVVLMFIFSCDSSQLDFQSSQKVEILTFNTEISFNASGHALTMTGTVKGLIRTGQQYLIVIRFINSAGNLRQLKKYLLSNGDETPFEYRMPITLPNSIQFQICSNSAGCDQVEFQI